MTRAGSRTPSFAFRAALAVALLLGFYVLGLAVIAVCLGGIWLQFAAGHIFLKLVLLCVVVGGSVAYAMLRTLFFFSQKFEPPGPEVTEAEQPTLFALIREVAAEMGATMPKNVYLIPDVNAFVAEVGGFLGFGTRRIMGIGVGLLQVDTVQQLKATIAHEFGHYQGGDTRLGGFLYRTRAALVRVIGTLGEGLVSSLFMGYFKMFLRVSHGISRAQELAADEASVRVAGTKAHVDGLRREARGGVLFRVFLQSEVAPLVDAGFQPADFYKGFRITTKELGKQGLSKSIDRELATSETDPYDSHPALPERIAYAEGLRAVSKESDDRLAREVLKDPPAVERRVADEFLRNITAGARLQAVSWRDSGAKVFGPKLAEEAERIRAHFAKKGLPASNLLEAAGAALDGMGKKDRVRWMRHLDPAIDEVSHGERAAVADRQISRFVAVCLGTELVRRGGTWHSVPGRSLEIVDGDVTHDIFGLARKALDDKKAREELRDQIRTLASPEPKPASEPDPEAKPEPEPEATP
jgi:Zn-dependent protease with chaperone function